MKKIIKRIINWWNRKNEPNIPKYIHAEGNYHPSFGYAHAEGHASETLGKNDDFVLIRVCNYPQKRVIEEDYLKDNLPVPESAWTHCIYCVEGKCYYDGNCQYKKINWIYEIV